MKNLMIKKESAEYLQKKFTAFRIYSSREVHDLAPYFPVEGFLSPKLQFPTNSKMCNNNIKTRFVSKVG